MAALLVLGCAAPSDPPAARDAAAPDAAVADAAASEASPADGAPLEASADVAASTVARVRAVAAGTNHTCAVHEDGRVSCWGYGPFIGPGLPAVTLPRPVPLGRRATAVQVGIQAACALLDGGEVSCWGDLDGRGPQAPGPVVKEDGTVLDAVTRIAGGSLAFCGSRSDGIFCWGDNKAAELARPPSLTFPALTAVLADARPRTDPRLAASVAMLVHDGADELCGWGSNDSGILPGARGLVDRPRCQRGIPGILQLSAGDGHVCARRGGAAFSCWGSNSGGQLALGDDGPLEVAPPGSPRNLPAPIVGIASAAYHSCAVLETGAVLCWGSNEHGEVGRAPSAPLFDPAPVTGFRAKVVDLGAGAGAQHTCALLVDGSLACWGYDNAGQLGAGASTEDADRFSAAPLPVRF